MCWGFQRVGHDLATEQQSVKFMGPQHFKMVLTVSAKKKKKNNNKKPKILRSQWSGTRDISWGRAIRNHEGSNSRAITSLGNEDAGL